MMDRTNMVVIYTVYVLADRSQSRVVVEWRSCQRGEMPSRRMAEARLAWGGVYVCGGKTCQVRRAKYE